MPTGTAPEKRANPVRPLRILLVDDDVALTRSLSAGLEKLGFKVIAAGTAADALAVIADSSVDLDVIVMDLVLPDSWGSQVAMERTLYRPQIPVIFISGYARGDAVLAASMAADSGPFLEKPFTTDELAAVVRQVAGQGGAGPA